MDPMTCYSMMFYSFPLDNLNSKCLVAPRRVWVCPFATNYCYLSLMVPVDRLNSHNADDLCMTIEDCIALDSIRICYPMAEVLVTMRSSMN